MRLVADENIDYPIIVALRSHGFDVLAIAEIAAGALDPDVLARSTAEAGILLTADKDFGDLVFRQRQVSHGVVLVRISGFSNEFRVRVVTTAFLTHAASFEGNFSVIEPGSVRIRHAPQDHPGAGPA